MSTRPRHNVITDGTRLSTAIPSFCGGYAEVGYYLTGESRGYKGGKWDRTKVLKPFDKGGWGAIQLNRPPRLSRPRHDRSAAAPATSTGRFSGRGLDLRQWRQAARLPGQPDLDTRWIICASWPSTARRHHRRPARRDGRSRLGQADVNERKYGVDTAAVRASSSNSKSPLRSGAQEGPPLRRGAFSYSRPGRPAAAGAARRSRRR